MQIHLVYLYVAAMTVARRRVPSIFDGQQKKLNGVRLFSIWRMTISISKIASRAMGLLPAFVIERSTDLPPTIHYFVDDDALVRLSRWSCRSFSASGDYIDTANAVCSFYMSREKKLLESLSSLSFAYLYIANLCGR